MKLSWLISTYHSGIGRDGLRRNTDNPTAQSVEQPRFKTGTIRLRHKCQHQLDRPDEIAHKLVTNTTHCVTSGVLRITFWTGSKASKFSRFYASWIFHGTDNTSQNQTANRAVVATLKQDQTRYTEHLYKRNWSKWKKFPRTWVVLQ